MGWAIISDKEREAPIPPAPGCEAAQPKHAIPTEHYILKESIVTMGKCLRVWNWIAFCDQQCLRKINKGTVKYLENLKKKLIGKSRAFHLLGSLYPIKRISHYEAI